jgi:peptidoglycan/LPS O-acetylase OafA/YrhL
MERKPYVDGLRGAAACMVLFGHLWIALASPLVMIQGSSESAKLLLTIAKLPGVLWNGNFGVCIFFVLSGYVLSGLIQKSSMSFPAQVARRYIRLALPVVLTSIFAWALLAAGAYHNKEAGAVVGSSWLSGWYQFPPSFLDMIWRSLVTTFFVGDATIYNPNLWTMQPEFVGSFLVFLINAFSANRYVRTALLLLWAVLADLRIDSYLPLFAAGALLFEFEAEMTHLAKSCSALAFAALASFGLYLGVMQVAQHGQFVWWYSWLPQLSDDPNNNVMHWHGLGAILLTATTLLAPFLQAALGSAVGRYLGRISFVLYLIQIPVICSFTSWVVIAMGEEPKLLVIAVAGVSTALLIFLISTATYRLIDGNSIRISRMLGQRLDSIQGKIARIPMKLRST